MFKLIFSKYLKNTKIFIGTFITIAVSVMIILGCLALIWGTVKSSDNGMRFNNVDVVVSKSEILKVEVIENDGDKDIEKEELKQIQFFSEKEIEDIKNELGTETVILDRLIEANLKIADIEIKSMIVHNFSSIELTGFDYKAVNISKYDVVIDSDFADKNNLNIGDNIKVQYLEFKHDLTVKEVVSHSHKDVYKMHNYVYLSDELMDDLEGKTYNIGIKTNTLSNLDIVAKYENDYDVFFGEEINDGEISSLTRNYFSQMIAIITMASICLLASLFVIMGTISFSVKHRQKEFGMLRTLGLSKRQLRTILLVEHLLVYVLAFVVGLLLAMPFANLIKGLYIDINLFDEFYFPKHNIVMILITFGGFLLLLECVAILVGGKSLKTSPMQAMKEENITDKSGKVVRIVAGVILFGGAIAIILSTPYYSGLGIGMAFICSGLMLGGFFVAAPLVMRGLNAVFAVFTGKMYSSLGNVAKSNIKEKSSKFAIAAISLALMFSLNAVMFLNNQTFIEYNATSQYEVFENYNYYVTNEYDNFDLNDKLMVKYDKFIYKGNNVESVDVVSLSDFTHINLELNSGEYPSAFEEIIISRHFKKVNLGDEVTLVLADGTEAKYKVVGKYESLKDEKQIFMYIDDVVATSFSKTYSAIYFKLDNLDIANQKGYSLQHHNLEQYKSSPEYDVQMGALVLMIIVSFILTIIGLFNTFAMVMTVRKKEFNLLRLIGANKKQIIKMTLIETGIVTLTGLLIGIVITAVCVSPYSLNMFGKFDFIVNAKIFFGILGSVVILGILAGMLPSIGTIRKLKQQVEN